MINNDIFGLHGLSIWNWILHNVCSLVVITGAAILVAYHVIQVNDKNLKTGWHVLGHNERKFGEDVSLDLTPPTVVLLNLFFLPVIFSSSTNGIFRLSVCPSVCLSVRLSHLFDYVPIIVASWHFQELLPMTKVRSMQRVKVRGQSSRSQRSQTNLTVSGL